MDRSKKQKLNKQKYVLQRNNTDCGVVCLLSILKIFGKNCCYHDIYKKSGCSYIGTNIIGLQNAAKAYKVIIEAFQFEDINDLKCCNSFPCILLIKKYCFFNHYIICCERPTNNSTLIFDPSKGFRLWNSLQLNKFWKLKIALIVTDRN